MDEDKRRLKGKLHRVIYAFNISRLFTPVKHFAKKTEGITPEAIRAAISSIFQPKKEKEKTLKLRPLAGREAREMQAPSTGAPGALLIAIMAVALIVIYGTYLYISIGAQPPAQLTNITKPEAPVLNVYLGDSGYLDAGKAVNTKWYSYLDIDGMGLDKAAATLVVQEDQLPYEIFILRTDNYQFADHYSDFYLKLKERLAEKGLVASEITQRDLLSIPSNRKIILLVPSGNIPALLLGQETENFDMKKFAKGGNVIVYIGQSPGDGSLLAGSQIPQPVSPDTISKRFGIVLGKEPPGTKPKRFTFSEALFGIQPASGEQIERPTITNQAGESVLSWGGSGYVYMIPTTIDFWWSASGEKSAKELATALIEGYWGKDLTRGTLELAASDDAIASQRVSIFSTTFIPKGQEFRPTKAAGRIYVQATKTVNNISSITGKALQVIFADRPLGTIEQDEEAIPTALTEQPLELRYSLNEPGSGAEQLFLSVIDKNGTEVVFTQITAQPVSLRISRATYRFDNTLPSGDYILRIANSARTVYAQSFLHVVKFRVESESRDFASGRFTFLIYEEDKKEVYTGTLKHVKISIDGKDEKDIESAAGRLQYVTQPVTSFGNHTATVQLGADRQQFMLSFLREASIFEKPENIAAIIITIILFAIGVMIARPEEVRYGIDVPDFPPLQAIAIPVKRDTVLGVFDTVNKDLRWQFTPLSITDLKAGFKKVLHRGRSIIIGDYNLERILDKLIEEGYLVKALDYYGLKRWEKESGKSIHTLAMMRSIRDIFVNEGIPFVPFGQRTDADSMISMGGERVFIHTFEDDRVIPRAITTAMAGRTVVIFEDEISMRSFMDRIHSSSETNVTFKLLVDNGKIDLAPTNRLMDVLSKRYVFHYY